MVLEIINKYKRLHQTDWGCLIAASIFFLVAVVVITLMLGMGDS